MNRDTLLLTITILIIVGGALAAGWRPLGALPKGTSIQMVEVAPNGQPAP